MDTLGARLKQARQDAGLTQQQLSAKSGLKQSDISKLERGDSQTTTRIAELAMALGVSPIWLATGNGEKKAGWVTISNPVQVAQAVDLLADRINQIETLVHRQLIAERLQTLAMAPDSAKARNGVLESLAWSDAVDGVKVQSLQLHEPAQNTYKANIRSGGK